MSNPLLANKTIVLGHNPISVKNCEVRILFNLDVINIDTGITHKDKEGFGRHTGYECNS